MAQKFKLVSLVIILVLLFPLLPVSQPFTVIMSDSGSPSALMDGPQTGFGSNKDGSKTDPAEQEAVYDVMRATGNGWATEIPDVCRGRWHGIECMPDNKNVLHVVSLSFGALSDDTAFPTCDPSRAHISPSVTRLPHLRTLFFYRCLTQNPQPIPSFLGLLGPNLQTLVLRENGHVGEIPPELGNLTRVRILDLHGNSLNGSIPDSLNRITGLWSLDLSSNRLSGSIPGLGFPVLSVVDFSQNLLVGPIPSSVSKCRSLVKIDFSRNRLTGSIPESIGELKELTLLDLSYNGLLGPIPGSMKSLVSLQALILKGNPMGSIIPSDGFRGMKGLMILILSNMGFQGPIPSSLAQLPSLRVLHLDENRFNGSIPVGFKELKNLSELRLNDNWLIGLVPFEREMVWRMRKKLRLYNNLGLCFRPNSGLDSSLNSGIGPCDSAKPGSPRSTIQHFVAVRGSEQVSSSGAIRDRRSFVCILFVAMVIRCILFN